MSSLAWSERPLEERVALNPAFLALLLRSAASGYEQESERPLPIPLTFVALPLVLHRPTRDALPTIATSLPVWLQDHQLLREGFANRARAIAPAVREALTIGLSTSLVRLSLGGIVEAAEPQRARHATAEIRHISTRARFVGRWLARAGDVATVYLLLGLRP
jgi:hypothetical protein